MTDNNTISKFRELKTPFYYYDLNVLTSNLDNLKKETSGKDYKVHYALKANANPKILKIISSYGFGADCVYVECFSTANGANIFRFSSAY